MFTWIPFYEELAKKLLEYRDRQDELIDIIKKMHEDGCKTISIEDIDENDKKIPLTEIDPFTFFANFNRGITEENRIKICGFLKNHFNLKSDVPEDFVAIPIVSLIKSWFFAYKNQRKDNDIFLLWNFAEAIVLNDKKKLSELFNQVLNIKNIGITNLTMGMYWFKPNDFLAVDSVNIEYLKSKYSLKKPKDHDSYMQFLEDVKSKADKSFYEISHEAWESPSKTNYWVFQGNPKVFDFEMALREDTIETWTVKSHLDKIKIGDKGILWITGKNSGCYALVEIMSSPHKRGIEKDEKYWNQKPNFENVVDIKITHNFIDNPVLKSEIEGSQEFINFKGGNQGTNFSAKEEEYLKLLEMRNEMNETKYWIYAPGENAEMWDEFYKKGIMAIGWHQLGDLRSYKNKEEVTKKLQEIFKTDSSKKNDATANYDFVNNISVGDIILVKKGKNKIIGKGIVLSDYYFDPEAEDYKSQRKIKWTKRGTWEFKNLVLKTLTDITNYPSDKPEYDKYYEEILNLFESSNADLELSLNTILYGPPGTGKTYEMRNKYFDIFTQKAVKKTQTDIANEIVEHLSWWETIALVLLDLDKAIKVKDIFEHKLLKAKADFSNSKNVRATIWGNLQYHTKEDCPNVGYKKRGTPQFIWKDDSGNWSIDKEIAEKETPELFDYLNKFNTDQGQEKDKKLFEFVTFHQSYSYEDFIEGIKPVLAESEDDASTEGISYRIEDGIFKKLAKKAKGDPDNNYAIFIDEINRGNIANIFGELITLIEEDKRTGMDNMIEATLPYSKDKFSVPANLYIIGTMNTADRSVEALDTALRRRFAFEEMLPKPKLLEKEEYACEGIDLCSIYAINNRIERLLDKDYCIGHSYFMCIKNKITPLEELKDVFINKILPLLQEYFYGDWGKIILILGEGFVIKNKVKSDFLNSNLYDDFEEYEEKAVYNLTESSSWTMSTFKSIYEKKE